MLLQMVVNGIEILVHLRQNGHLSCLQYAWRWFGDLLVVPGGCSDLAQLMPTACFHAHFLCAVPDVGYV